MLLAVAALRRPYLTVAFITITQLGSALGLAVSALLLTWWLRRRQAAVIRQPILSVSAAWLANELLKVLVRRSRPDIVRALVSVRSFSYPSGHAFVSMVFYWGAAAALAGQMPRRWVTPIRVGAAVVIALVGFSRVYLGVHYPSDVLGGYGLGLACALAADRITGSRSQLREPGRQ